MFFIFVFSFFVLFFSFCNFIFFCTPSSPYILTQSSLLEYDEEFVVEFAQSGELPLQQIFISNQVLTKLNKQQKTNNKIIKQKNKKQENNKTTKQKTKNKKQKTKNKTKQQTTNKKQKQKQK